MRLLERKNRAPSRLTGGLLLLLLLAALLPLGTFLAGFLPGGKSRGATEPEPAPRHEPGTLDVFVVRAGEPVEGARVVVERLAGGEAEAESDAQGRARIGGLRGGPVRVEATVGGRKVEAWADPAVRREILLSVGPEAARAGRVLLPDGSPARARVALLAEDGRELAAAETDTQGRYALPDLPEAAAACATAEGLAPAAAPRGDLALREGTLVEGRLLGAGAGSLAVFGRVAAPHSDEMVPFRAEWRVAADGSFRGRLPPGAEAFGSYGGLPVRIAPGAVELPKPARATGFVRRADGEPASRAVLLFRPLLGDFATPLLGLRVEADARGEFSAAGFADVPYSVEVYAPDCATRVVPEVMPGRGSLEITLEPGYAVGGFVVDAAGLPVPGARIRAMGLPEDADRPVLSAETDAQGRFRIAGLGGTHARLRVTADGYHATTVDRAGRGAQARVVLQSDR